MAKGLKKSLGLFDVIAFGMGSMFRSRLPNCKALPRSELKIRKTVSVFR